MVVVVDATSGLLTEEHFDTRLGVEREYLDARLGAGIAELRAEFSRGLLLLGLSLAGFVIGVAGVSLAAAALLFD